MKAVKEVRTDGVGGGRNGTAARDFRGQEVHWVAGRGRQGRESQGRAVEDSGSGRVPGVQSTQAYNIEGE